MDWLLQELRPSNYAHRAEFIHLLEWLIGHSWGSLLHRLVDGHEARPAPYLLPQLRGLSCSCWLSSDGRFKALKLLHRKLELWTRHTRQFFTLLELRLLLMLLLLLSIIWHSKLREKVFSRPAHHIREFVWMLRQLACSALQFWALLSR